MSCASLSIQSRRVGELHALREGRLVGEVECARAPAHVLLPRVATGLTTPAGALCTSGQHVAPRRERRESGAPYFRRTRPRSPRRSSLR